MTTNTDHQGPLTGLNVIDFGHYYAGPMAGMLLADQGANVIRIAKSGEPELLSQQYRLLNRNKKLLELDLKTEAGKAQALSLIEHADVVIENFRPGVMKRLGLDYASVKDTNPELVYLSLPGFASTDKERAHIQAWEGVMNAASCAYTETHWWRQQLGFPPVYTWVPFCSAHGSMQGTIAVLAALISRETHGHGTMIEVSLVAAALSGLTPMLFGHTSGLAAFTIPDNVKASLALSPDDGETIQLDKLNKAARMMAFDPFHRAYPCKGGREIMLWIQSAKARRCFCEHLGLDAQAEREGIDLSNPLNPEQKQRVVQWVSEALLTKEAEEWESFLGDANVAVAMIRTRDEWMALEPMLQSGIFVRMDNGKSRLTVPGNFVDVSTPGETVFVSSFREAESIDTKQAQELFKARAVKTVPISHPAFLKKGDLLKGLKVLDLTNLVAGPTSTYTLAQYGAEVIKSDPPDTVNIALVGSSMLEVNQGKRSILTDVKTTKGREVFRRLVSWADVVVHNSIDGVAECLEVTQAQLQKINPSVVVCQFSAYGGTDRNRGGWEKRPGFDNQVQAVSGMMVHYGTVEKPQLHGLITCGDIMGGIGGTFATLLAVYQQRKTGYAGEARCSLARMINFIQLPCMISENGSSDWGEAQGQFALGESSTRTIKESSTSHKADWWRRLYQCSDRWIYVETTKERASELAEIMTGQSRTDTSVMESAFLQHESAYWLSKLNNMDISCHLALNGIDIKKQATPSVDNQSVNDTAIKTYDLFVRNDHPSGSPIVTIGPSWALVGEDRSYLRLTPAPRYGEHTREILAELGYSREEIDQLIDHKVSHEYLPALGSKEVYFL